MFLENEDLLEDLAHPCRIIRRIATGIRSIDEKQHTSSLKVLSYFHAATVVIEDQEPFHLCTEETLASRESLIAHYRQIKTVSIFLRPEFFLFYNAQTGC
jgi:hypothetical protein